MKNLKLFFLLAFTLIVANSAFAQSRIGGRVIEIVDGKTVVIEMQNRSRFVAELQYIEVPETGQPFNEIAKEHLRTLVFDKLVEFRARGLRKTVTVGQLLLKGVDISQQMIRDGAAWYAVMEKSGQDAAESEIYQINEAQAKTEKRGVWSIENLKPSWVVRAEAEENSRRVDKLAQEQIAKMTNAGQTTRQPKPAVKRQMSNESLMWSSTPETTDKMPTNVKNVGGLIVGYNPQNKFGIVITPLLKLEVPAKDTIQAIGIGIGYFYQDSEIKGRESLYLVGIEADSRDFRFLKYNDLIITADNQKIVVGKARRAATQNGSLVKELLLYRVKRSVVAKIANAKNVKVKVGTYSGDLNSSVQMMLVNLLNASE